MTVDMPAWNSHIDSCFWVDLHALREIQNAAAKILGPLTANVVGNENPREYDPSQCEEDNPIHITVPKDQ